MDELNLKISASPHVRSNDTTSDIMFDVIMALVPTTVVGLYHFGVHAAILLVVCIVTCMLAEFFFQKAVGKKTTVSDCSAILTGLLLGLNLPPELPVWMAILGSLFAIIIVKQLFGGLGQNFMNPALGARCFLLLSFSKHMTKFVYDGVTTATPLAKIKAGLPFDMDTVHDMFFGYTAGTIGEASTIALLLGALYLLIKKVISPKIPLVYIGTFAACIAIYAAVKDYNVLEYTLAHICGGGLMLGAWFMATDYVTSPITPWGKVIFGVILGLLTFVLRIFGNSAEGVSFAIIIANLLVPLIEKCTAPKPFGYGAEIKDKAAEKAAKKEAKAKEKAEDKSEVKTDTKTAFDIKGIVKAVCAIFVITVFMGAALGVIFDVTKDPIADANEKAKQAAYKEVYPDAAEVKQAKNLDYDKMNELLDQIGFKSDRLEELCVAMDSDGKPMGAIFVITNKDGYGGDITMAIGISLENKVTGISFLTINETVGLGMNAKKAKFKDQFVGKDISSGFDYTKTESQSDNVVNAISGATITTSAVVNGVNAAVALETIVVGGALNE